MSLPARHTASPLNIFTVMTNLARQHDACNLSQGLPDYPVPEELSHLLKDSVDKGFNQYAPMPGLVELREQIARDVNERYGTTFGSVDTITITPGATYGIYTALTAIVNKGDEVIYIEPAFDCYLPAIEINGGIPVRVTLQAATGFALDWQQLQDALSTKTKAILINTPHNPTGYVWTQADWDQLATIIGNREIYVISDEVYDNLVFDHKQHLPGFLQEGLKNKVISIYSFGKTLHITGWKIGYCIAAPEITNVFRSVHQYLTFSVNTPAQNAIAQYLQIYNRNEASNFLQAKRDLLYSGMYGSKFNTGAPCSGTYFQLYDYSAISTLNDVEFAKWLTIQHKVAAIPLSAFYKVPSGEKIIRLCFAKRDEVIIKATEILHKL